MSFEINVCRNGQHLFATHDRSLTDSTKAGYVLDIFRTKFPAIEGYELLLNFSTDMSVGQGDDNSISGTELCKELAQSYYNKINK